MEIFVIATVIVLGIVVDWWLKNRRRVIESSTKIRNFFARLLGYVVVEHIVEWQGYQFTDTQIFSRGVSKETIRQNNIAFARKQIQLHNLQMESDVTWHWRYAGELKKILDNKNKRANIAAL